MKRSLALSLLLAALFSTLLWRGQRRLDDLAAAGRGGTRAEIDFPAEKTVREVPRDRGAEALFPDLLAFCLRNDPDDPAGKELERRFRELPPGELKKLLARLLDTPGIPAGARSGIVGESIGQLAAEDPAGALEIFARHGGELEKGDVKTSALATAIGERAKDDPQAALAWFLENQKARSEFFGMDEAAALFRGTAEYDPRLAFALFDTFAAEELKKLVPDPSDPFVEHNFLMEIAATARTDSQRTAMVAALRDYVATTRDQAQFILGWSAIGGGLPDQPSAATWILSAGLTQNELQVVMRHVPLGDAREMATWMGFAEQKLDAEGRGEFLWVTIARWSDKDHGALARWLAEQPASDFAQSAAATFAEYLAEESIETALVQLRTLPTGPMRRAAFRALAKNLPPGRADLQEIQREAGR